MTARQDRAARGAGQGSAGDREARELLREFYSPLEPGLRKRIALTEDLELRLVIIPNPRFPEQRALDARLWRKSPQEFSSDAFRPTGGGWLLPVEFLGQLVIHVSALHKLADADAAGGRG